MNFLHLDVIGEILADSWRDYSKLFTKIAVVCLAFKLPSCLLDLAVSLLTPSQGLFHGAISFVVYLIGLSLDILLVAALLKLFSAARKGEVDNEWLKKNLLSNMGVFLRLLGVYAIINVVVIVAFIILGVASIILKMAIPFKFLCDALTITLALLLLGPAVWAVVRLSLALPACVLEGWGPIRATVRSFVMTAGNFLILLPVYITALCPAIIFSFASSKIFGKEPLAHFILSLAAALIGAMLIPAIHQCYLRLSGEGE